MLSRATPAWQAPFWLGDGEILILSLIHGSSARHTFREEITESRSDGVGLCVLQSLIHSKSFKNAQDTGIDRE